MHHPQHAMARVLLKDFGYVALLKDCAKRKDIREGIRLHGDVLKSGLLHKSPYLASTLVNMYAKCGMVAEAHRNLDELPFRDVVSWNALISGYVQEGKGREALNCFEQMRFEGLSPDVVTFTCVLRACASIGAIEKGKQLHDEIVSKGLLEKDVAIGTSLVDLYAKCGQFIKARQVLEELPLRDVVTWNVLIRECAQQRHGHEALSCFERMKHGGFSPDMVTFVCILKACGSIGAVEKGTQIHDEIVRGGFLKKDAVLYIALVDMYINLGMLANALDVLEEFPVQMAAGLELDILVGIVKACGRVVATEKGKQIHDEIVRWGFRGKDLTLHNALIDMYTKCSMLVQAEEVFREIPFRDIGSWNALVTGYVHQGKCEEVMNCFHRIRREGLCPDVVTFLSMLKACGISGTVEKGKQIHEEILSRGLLEREIAVGNALLDMYAKCGLLKLSQRVAEELPIRNIVSWSTLIAGYARWGQDSAALDCFEQMQREGVTPDAVSFVCGLKACGHKRDVERGKQIHGEVAKAGLLGKEIALGGALVDMYAKCGDMSRAREVLEELPIRGIECWSALIAGYAQQGKGHEAVECFEQMRDEGLSPNAIALACILNACGSMGALEKGEEIREHIIDRGLPKDVVLGNALLDMYVKCGRVSEARGILEELPVRDIVSWSTLISGYARQGRGDEALKCFAKMRAEGISPNVVTFLCLLRACGAAGAIREGERIHDEIRGRGLLAKDAMLGNALVGMYANCGELSRAREALKELPLRNVAAWNALIAGHARRGRGHEALRCLEEMESEGISPDEVTLLCVLNACGHSGLVDEAQIIFGEMTRRYGISPSLQHRTCMVMAFGCGGSLEKATAMIEAMPSPGDRCLSIWIALLGGCRKWGDAVLGMLAFSGALQVGADCAAAYELMANIFAAAGMQADAEKVEAMQRGERL